MSKIIIFLMTVILAVHLIHAAPELAGKPAEAKELQARIDRRAQEIATMTAYSERLERMLIHAGLPADQSVRQLSLEQKMDHRKVKVSTAEEAATHVQTKTYDVSAILVGYPNLQEGQDLLAKLLTDTVAPDTWLDAGGTVGSLRIAGGKITVTQMPVNLAEIESILANLDLNKEIPQFHATIGQQETDIMALSREIDKRIARCRSAGIRVPPRLDRALELMLPDTEFIGSPLSTCFDALRSASGQDIFVNWKLLEAAGIDHRMPITLSLHRQTLAAAMRYLIDKASERGTALHYDAGGNSIFVSTQQDFDQLTVTRVYDVRDLLPGRGNRDAAVDQLLSAITTNIDPDSWKDAGGTIGSIRELQGRLIITHCERVQVRIRTYLDKRLSHDCATSRSRPSP